MIESPDSLEAVVPALNGNGAARSTMDPHPATLAGDEESPPEFDRVVDVLGPLEQIVLAADQELGSIQQRISAETGEMTDDIERRVRDAALEQRRRVAQLRTELTDRASELAVCFEAMLNMLDEADRGLAIQAGVEPTPEDRAADVRVTVTERQTVTISHEGGLSGELGASAGPPPINQPAKDETPRKEKRFRRWFRRSKGSSA